MSDAFTKFAPNFDAVLEFHKANFQALVQTQALFAKGVQELSKEFVAQAQSQLESFATAGKSAFAAKTVQEALELNVDTAKQSYERLVAGSTRLTELSIQVTNEAIAPMKARATEAAAAMKSVATV